MTELSEREPPSSPPSDYHLILPDGWFRIPLEPGRRERSVEAWVNRRFIGVDDAPQLRQLMRPELVEYAAEAFEKGGIEL
ncbi:hypothetical protein ACYF6T_38105 [Streptomyces sp. 7R007]